MWEKAVRYLRLAAGKAFARSANREAVTYLEQALWHRLLGCRRLSLADYVILLGSTDGAADARGG